MTPKTGVTGLNTRREVEENFPYRRVFSSECYYEAIEVVREFVAYYSIVRGNS
jgi:hypothetical protein